MEETTSLKERVAFLVTAYSLSENNAKALLLAEFGYSSSGIAQVLDVSESTAKGYLKTLEECIGEGVTESLPKSRRYPTFPGDTPKGDVEYAGDYVDYSPHFSKRQRPINRGRPITEIPKELISIDVKVEV